MSEMEGMRVAERSGTPWDVVVGVVVGCLVGGCYVGAEVSEGAVCGIEGLIGWCVIWESGLSLLWD